MKKNLRLLFAEKIGDIRLPRYRELPDVGLYLEQVSKYINGHLVPLGFTEITASMISNYVKKGIIESPYKKQYTRDQIGYLIVIGVTKNVLSMDQLSLLFRFQKESYDCAVAYEYFCDEFENVLKYICGIRDSVENVGEKNSELKTLFRDSITASCHLLFVNSSFDIIKDVRLQKNAP